MAAVIGFDEERGRVLGHGREELAQVRDLLLELHHELDALDWDRLDLLQRDLGLPSRVTSASILLSLPCWSLRDWEACYVELLHGHEVLLGCGEAVLGCVELCLGLGGFGVVLEMVTEGSSVLLDITGDLWEKS